MIHGSLCRGPAGASKSRSTYSLHPWHATTVAQVVNSNWLLFSQNHFASTTICTDPVQPYDSVWHDLWTQLTRHHTQAVLC